MDLSQNKLSKTEWITTEIPVSDDEKFILKMIIDGYHNINIRTNKNQSLFQIMKIEYTPENEIFLYKKYFEQIVESITKIDPKISAPTFSDTKKPKKIDILRIEQTDKVLRTKTDQIFEFVILEICKNIASKPTQIGFGLYTLIQLKKSTIPNTNKHVLAFADRIIAIAAPTITISTVISQAYEFIEKNPSLLKYEDITLFDHQKQLFSIAKDTTPKLVLYIAPTGTGKTLSPLGLSEQYRVIFICVARHVGLALAKSAISMGKKVAFAFGCETASDIRLHYFAASNYTVNKRSGSIAKVDNSIGDKVEIMICDVKSYVTAMLYMLAFNPEENIITYWDEPTITMDYPDHELHAKIRENWQQNKISKMVLSCATLPCEQEIQDTIIDFRCKFGGPTITIASFDCRKSIRLLNKEGRTMLPHTISEFANYDRLIESTQFCEKNKTMLRYFDLSEIVHFIEYIHRGEPSPLAQKYHIDTYFGDDISEITMNSIKIYYLKTLRNLDKTRWPEIHAHFAAAANLGGVALRKVHSMMVEPHQPQSHPIKKISSASTHDGAATAAATGILLTTQDAHTLTDGPTIFIAEDVEKIGKFYIQYSKIPQAVFDRITEKIEKNNRVQQQLELQQQRLEDKMGTSKPTTDDAAATKKDRKNDRREEMDPEIRRMIQQIDTLRGQILSVNLDSVYIPNSATHQMLWVGKKVPNAFAPNIEDETIKEIMELSVDNNMKILLMLGIGMFSKTPSAAYTEIMKRLAYEQKLYLIIASSDYIYGTNYAFCHGFIGKDLTNMTQQKIIQAMGRVGRNKIQQDYTVRFRDDSIMLRLFLPQMENLEAVNMNRLFS